MKVFLITGSYIKLEFIENEEIIVVLQQDTITISDFKIAKLIWYVS